jgi:hypothetical protein
MLRPSRVGHRAPAARRAGQATGARAVARTCTFLLLVPAIRTVAGLTGLLDRTATRLATRGTRRPSPVRLGNGPG